MRKDLEKKKNDLLQNIIFNNGQLHGRLSQKNIKIAERIKELSIVRHNTQDPVTAILIKSEIDWLTELADI